MNWRVQVLGRLALIQGQREITHFESARVAVLLAYLAIHWRRPHPREELIELLWPDEDPALTRPRLRQALYSLRHQLEPPGVAHGSLLIADRNTVRLNPAAFTCDAIEFERLALEGRSREARTLYVGDLLPGFYDDWILLERERLAEIREALPPQSSRSGPVESSLHSPFLATSEAACLFSPAIRPALIKDDPVEAGGSGAERRLPAGHRDPVRLPGYLNQFLARADETRDLKKHLHSHRLVTLCGLGGVGKTRLATAAAAAVAEDWDGVAFVPLADCVAPIQIPEAIRDALWLPASAAPAMDQVVSVLEGRRTLLILDNFEQLVSEGGAAIVETLLTQLPGLTCLVTSRRTLGIDGEQEFSLQPFPLPPAESTLADTTANASVALFVSRAQAVRPVFQLTANNRNDVAALCRQLEGIPLAIEIAASRIRSMSPGEMHRQIDDRFRWLVRSGPGADKEPRRRSLAATLDWSWRLLSPSQQRFLGGLSVFRAGWTTETAEIVCAVPDAGERMDSLLMDSLIFSEETPWGATRFRMLETVRAFALERLPPEDLSLLLDRHRAAFLALVNAPVDNAPAILHEAGNITLALETAIESGDADKSFALCNAGGSRWMALVGAQMALRLFRRALQLPGGDARARVETLALASYIALLTEDGGGAADLAEMAMWASDSPAARAVALMARSRIKLARYEPADEVDAWLSQAIDFASSAGDARTAGIALRLRGALATRAAEYAAAEEYLNRSLHLLDGLDRLETIRTLDNLANIAVHQGSLERALQLYESCRTRSNRAGDSIYSAKVLQNLACIYARQERWEESITVGRECILRNHDLGNAYILSIALWNLAEPLTYTGQDALAVAIMGGMARIWVEQYGPLDEADIAYLDTIRTRASANLGDKEASAFWDAGERLSLPELVRLALSESAL